MSFPRVLRVAATSAALALVVGTVTATAAEAGKPAPAPTGIAATVTAHPSGTYDVAASWNATASATSYKVSLTKGGATLASATVTKTSWTPTVTTTPGSASLSVRAVIGKRQGKPGAISVPLPDVTAPAGSYSSSWNNNTGLATITQDSLTDNSPVSGVTRTVNWGVGSPVAWPAGTTITHTYPLTAMRYTPTVTLEDAAHNVAVVDVPAVVINDSEAPTGTFTAGPATGSWAKLSQVSLSQTAIHDNWSPDANITRMVDWKDGTAPQAWTGATASHVYAVGGTFTPQVTLTDEAGNSSAAIDTSAVTVTVDSARPVVKLSLPRSKNSVKAWTTLRGKATDAGTGVKSVWLKAVEKRGAAWYGYNPTTHKWAKAATKNKAFTKAKAFSLTTNAKHQWRAPLAKLRLGTLVYKVRATDRVNNVSATLAHTAKLTKP
jgi:hypothetical protein